MTYKPYSVVIVPFPFTESIRTKRRPALVLSTEKHQNETGHITLLMITSAKHSVWPSDYSIEHLKTTGLPSLSIIRQKIFTLDLTLIQGVLGCLSASDKKQVMNQLNQHLRF
ncbi:MAG: type II toxin-antitoxin system PemK/MazF family toxin [Legionellaceae bacterium]|nr:type II toxin-antitoxin system PemK/MazF family toxin [Legionellaceae bacterium]MBP9775814.1 type II toxin-antitoxin system PemK/MazF family toxin [Legionellaceae bacterium]